MEITFKIATNSDIDVLLTFIEEFYELEHLPFNIQIINQCLSEVFSDDKLAIVWLICADGEAVGYFVLTFGYSLEFHGRDSFIDEFYIRESYRGQGIGTKTLKFMETVCQSLGIKAIHLEVFRKNTQAKSIYEKVGYIEHNSYLMTKRIVTDK